VSNDSCNHVNLQLRQVFIKQVLRDPQIFHENYFIGSRYFDSITYNRRSSSNIVTIHVRKQQKKYRWEDMDNYKDCTYKELYLHNSNTNTLVAIKYTI